MFDWWDEPPPNGFRVLDVRRLPAPPIRDADSVYWDVDVSTDADGLRTIQAWTPDSAAKRLPTVADDKVEDWISEKVAQRAATVNWNIDALAMLSPLELHVPSLT